MPVPGTSWISSIFGRAPRRAADEAPASQPVATRIAPYLAGVPSYPANTTGTVIRDGYLRNPLIQQGIRMIFDTFAQAETQVRRAGSREVIADHRLPRVLKHPEPQNPSANSEYALWEWTLIDLFTSGNCFWELVRSRADNIVQIWQLKPERMAIIADVKRYIREYQYMIDGVWWPLEPRNVLHWKFYHPLDRYFGLSPILAAARALATDNAATDFLKLTLDNRAVPDVVVTSLGVISEPDAKKMKAQWKELYGGRNRGEVAVLQKGMEVKTLGMSLEDLAFPELQGGLETRILMSLGGAPLVYLSGAKAGMDRSTFANYGDAREALATEVVQPLWRRAQSLMNGALLPMFNDAEETEVVFDTRRVNAMEERRIRRTEAAVKLFASGVGLQNEARQMVGDLEDLPQNYLCRPVGMDFLPVDATGHVLEPPEPAVDAAGNPIPPGTTPAGDTADDFGAPN